MSISSCDVLIVYNMIHVDIVVNMSLWTTEFKVFYFIAFVVTTENGEGIGNFDIQSEDLNFVYAVITTSNEHIPNDFSFFFLSDTCCTGRLWKKTQWGSGQINSSINLDLHQTAGIFHSDILQ